MNRATDIRFTRLTPADHPLLRELIRVYAQEFTMDPFDQPDDTHLDSLLRSERTLFLAALDHGSVVGGLTAHVLPSVYSTAGEVYLYDLAVSAPYQRRGIGTGLLAMLRGVCREMGMRELFVQADIDDLHAVEFYRHTGGVAEQVIHFSYSAVSGND